MSKRYLAIIERATMKAVANAALVTGYTRGGVIFRVGNKIGYCVDYYPEEEAAYRREFGKNIVGDFASADEADSAIEKRMYGE